MPARGEAIVLIGFMGTGKSSAGSALAARTALSLHDTDRAVAARFGISIREIFARHGEEAFREAETEALAQIAAGPAVVVTGGGIVLRPQNVGLLRRLGTIVNLVADEATLFARVSRGATRPLLETEDPRATLSALLRLREPLYSGAADVTIHTSHLTHEEVADEILARVQISSSHAG